MNNEGVCRTALTTPGLLIKDTWLLWKHWVENGTESHSKAKKIMAKLKLPSVAGILYFVTFDELWLGMVILLAHCTGTDESDVVEGIAEYIFLPTP